MNNTEIATIIKKHDAKGAAGFWYISTKVEVLARINNKEIGQIKSFIVDMAKVGHHELKDLLAHPVCVWAKKTIFMGDLRASGITDEEAYNFILGQMAGQKVQVQKEGAQGLALILVSLAPNKTPNQLLEKLLTMTIEFKHDALRLTAEMEKTNGRDDEGWINTKQPKVKKEEKEDRDEKEVTEDNQGADEFVGFDVDELRRVLEEGKEAVEA